MTSSLFGIYNAQRALTLNQAAINLINTNISNINTEGYSKQRLEISQKTLILPESHLPLVASQSGVGSAIDGISRNREAYLDMYFRRENSDLSYYKELSENVLLIEDLTNELSDKGIRGALSEFYNAANQLSLNPSDKVARTNFTQRAIDVCTKFNQISQQLGQLQTSLVGDPTKPDSINSSKINLACDDLNAKLQALTELNKTISVSTAQGVTPNGLMDERDRLLDQISEYIPITVTPGVNNLLTVSYNGTNLVEGSELAGKFQVTTGNADNPAAVTIGTYVDGVPTGSVAFNDIVTGKISTSAGKIAAILEMGGSDPDKLNINFVLDKLNTLASEFSNEVNTIQSEGKFIYFNSSTPPEPRLSADPPEPFFIYSSGTAINASNITVNPDIISDPFKIAAASSAATETETGDGKNALKIAQLRNAPIDGLNSSSTEKYLNSVIGDIGSKSKSIKDKYEAQSNVIDQVQARRDSASGVNLDEELTDLMRYQRAYEASAKIFSVVDKMIQQIINLGS